MQYNVNCWKFLGNRIVEISSNANKGNETDKVSSLWGANTILQGQQNKNRTQKEINRQIRESRSTGR
jgi:hypothetical protein